MKRLVSLMMVMIVLLSFGSGVFAGNYGYGNFNDKPESFNVTSAETNNLHFGDQEAASRGIINSEGADTTLRLNKDLTSIVVEVSAKVDSWEGSKVTVFVNTVATGGNIKRVPGDIALISPSALRPKTYAEESVDPYDPQGTKYLDEVYILDVGDAKEIKIITKNFKATDIYGRVGSLYNYKSAVYKKSDF